MHIPYRFRLRKGATHPSILPDKQYMIENILAEDDPLVEVLGGRFILRESVSTPTVSHEFLSSRTYLGSLDSVGKVMTGDNGFGKTIILDGITKYLSVIDEIDDEDILESMFRKIHLDRNAIYSDAPRIERMERDSGMALGSYGYLLSFFKIERVTNYYVSSTNFTDERLLEYLSTPIPKTEIPYNHWFAATSVHLVSLNGSHTIRSTSLSELFSNTDFTPCEFPRGL